MPAHLFDLGRGQRARLAQHRIADAHLADVVQRRQRGDERDAARIERRAIGGPPGERGREDARQLLRPPGMPSRVGVARLGQGRQRLDDEALGIAAPPPLAIGPPPLARETERAVDDERSRDTDPAPRRRE